MQQTNIFISYSHLDEDHFVELNRQLQVVTTSMNLNIWADIKIAIGDELNQNIEENLAKADIVICLVSTDYLNSKYCIEKELNVAIEKKQLNQNDIFPIIVKPSLWKRTYFGQIKCAPKDGKPASTYGLLEDAYLEVVDSLMTQIEKKRDEKKTVY